MGLSMEICVVVEAAELVDQVESRLGRIVRSLHAEPAMGLGDLDSAVMAGSGRHVDQCCLFVRRESLCCLAR
jgi:hypothetical protein